MYPESTRQVPDFFFKQSAVIPYRVGPAGVEVLLVTNRTRRRWIVPKGVVEPFLSAAESALKEAKEEAGVEGEVDGPPLGTYSYVKWGGTCNVEVFPMRVTKEYPTWEESFRDRRWFGIEDAAAVLREAALGDLLRNLPAALGKAPRRAG
jgi:phosphohistidine phosphatase